MTKFRLYFEITASSVITVEADNEEAAEEKAFEQLPSELCAYCFGWGDHPGVELAGDWEAYSIWNEDTDEEIYFKERQK